jgi:D-3-phosphoglycerate dehydrogenase
VGTLLGEAGVNVASWNQARRGSGGEALAAIAVDQSIANGLRTRLEQLPDLLEVRVVNFG